VGFEHSVHGSERVTVALAEWEPSLTRQEAGLETATHSAGWVKDLQGQHGAPGVKQQLAAVRMLFDWLITGQIVPMNPAAAVRGPKHVVKTGQDAGARGRGMAQAPQLNSDHDLARSARPRLPTALRASARR
jgi:hypothetical protein